MRKVDDREKKEKKKIMTFIVATNVVASRPPECQPTGTQHARANCILVGYAYLLGFRPVALQIRTILVGVINMWL